MTFEVGQKVKCVDASKTMFGLNAIVTEGTVYTVESVVEDGRGITLREVSIPYGDKIGWHIERFEAADESSASQRG